MSYIYVRHPFSSVLSGFFIAFAYSLQFVNKITYFCGEITYFFLHLYLMYMGKRNKVKSFSIKFPSSYVSSLFSLYKYFYFIAASFFHCFSFFNSMSRFARCDISPYDDVILRLCRSDIRLVIKTSYVIVVGVRVSRILLCSAGKPGAMLANTSQNILW